MIFLFVFWLSLHAQAAPIDPTPCWSSLTGLRSQAEGNFSREAAYQALAKRLRSNGQLKSWALREFGGDSHHWNTLPKDEYSRRIDEIYQQLERFGRSTGMPFEDLIVDPGLMGHANQFLDFLRRIPPETTPWEARRLFSKQLGTERVFIGLVLSDLEVQQLDSGATTSSLLAPALSDRLNFLDPRPARPPAIDSMGWFNFLNQGSEAHTALWFSGSKDPRIATWLFTQPLSSWVRGENQVPEPPAGSHFRVIQVDLPKVEIIDFSSHDLWERPGNYPNTQRSPYFSIQKRRAAPQDNPDQDFSFTEEFRLPATGVHWIVFPLLIEPHEVVSVHSLSDFSGKRVELLEEAEVTSPPQVAPLRKPVPQPQPQPKLKTKLQTKTKTDSSAQPEAAPYPLIDGF